MARYIVIVDMKENNGHACAMHIDEDKQWLETFIDIAGIQHLKRQHPLGVFPWRVINLDDGTEWPTLLP